MKKAHRMHPLAAAVSVALGAGFGAAPLLAQEEEQAMEEIVVTAGYRRSLINSIDAKRESSLVIESITAEDIGKLPDQSIADSIARLPGLAAQRLDGRASSISIRGLGENFSATTLNGREQVSIGDNRGVEFDLYPSEIISGVTVYKTPNAALATQGVAGVIDMRTVRPLDISGRTVKLSAFFEENKIGALNPDGEDSGERYTVSYIDQYADGKFGVALVYNDTTSPSNEERWNAWGYPEVEHNGEMVKILGGAKPFVRTSELERESIATVFQYEASDNLSFTLDYMQIEFSDSKTLRGVEIPVQWGAENIAIEGVSNGVVTKASFDVSAVVRNDYEIREADLDAYGFNAKWEGDIWDIAFDYGSSEVDRTVWSLESYGTVAGHSGRGTPTGFTYIQDEFSGVRFFPNVNYGDLDVVRLGAARDWGNNHPMVNPDTEPTYTREMPRDGRTGYETALEAAEKGDCLDLDPVPMNCPAADTELASGQDGYINIPSIGDELETFRVDAGRHFDSLSHSLKSVKFGFYRSERNKTKEDRGEYLTVPRADDAVETFPTDPFPYRAYVGITDLNFIGLGGLASYDSFGFYQSGGYVRHDADIADLSRVTNDYDITEEVTIVYGMIDLAFDVANGSTLNIGLQLVDTDLTSDGSIARIVEVDGLPTVSVFDSSEGSSYDEWLPSITYNLHFTEELTLRAGWARTQSRTRMDRLKIGGEWGFNNELNMEGEAPWTFNGGNPDLRPNEADQLDFSLEYYFRDDGYVAVAWYEKDLRNWQIQMDRDFSLTDFVSQEALERAVPDAKSFDGIWNVWTEISGGEIDGLEITVAFPFGILWDRLEGLGIVWSQAEVDSSLRNPNAGEDEDPVISVPGLSEEIENLTIYYERGGFEGRVSMRERGDFYGERFGISFSREFTQVVGATLWDAQLSYDFAEGLTATFQALNLTDEPYETRAGDTGLTTDYQEFGTTYLVGVSYEF